MAAPRRIRPWLSTATRTSSGKGTSAASEMARMQTHGSRHSCAIAATAALSMSTAAAPVCAKARRLASTVVRTSLASASGAMQIGVRSSRQVESRSRQSRSSGRSPSTVTTDAGSRSVPADTVGSRAPAVPKLTSADAPRETRACAASVAARAPTPDTQINRSECWTISPRPRGALRPKLFASRARATTTPITTGRCDSGRAPTAGSTSGSRGSAGRRPAESREP